MGEKKVSLTCWWGQVIDYRYEKTSRAERHEEVEKVKDLMENGEEKREEEKFETQIKVKCFERSALMK